MATTDPSPTNPAAPSAYLGRCRYCQRADIAGQSVVVRSCSRCRQATAEAQGKCPECWAPPGHEHDDRCPVACGDLYEEEE